jgi:hypothetical protein
LHINTAVIRNFKSFSDSGKIQFLQGFNVILGKNNVGKTALLESLSLFPNGPNPHRDSKKRATQPINDLGELDLEVFFQKQELNDVLLSHGNIWFPITQQYQNPSAALEFFHKFLSNERIISLRYRTNGGWSPIKYPSHGMTPSPASSMSANIRRSDNFENFEFSGLSHSNNDNMYEPLSQFIKQNIYSFKAERLNLARSRFGSNSKLNPDASNLAEVLNILQDSRHLFDEYNKLLITVFDNIGGVSVRPVENSPDVQIRIWNNNAPPHRVDLAQPLSESGTGISQVLAMLYIIITSDSPRVIIIDEPNTFLYPGAVKKLFNIMNNNPVKHQFIISTHSPEVIAASDAKSVHMINWVREESTVEKLSISGVGDMRRSLMELGVKLSDVYGMDYVLWVEGSTEQECFPLIIKHFQITLPLATSVISLRAPTDIDGKRPEAKVFREIYDRVAKSCSLVPSAIAFILDREKRSQQERDDLERIKEYSIRFIPRRTYENYLIAPGAIHAIINNTKDDNIKKLSIEDIVKYISENKNNPEYWGLKDHASSDEYWEKNIDAPKLLRNIFSDLTSARQEFRKIPHSIQLTEWILENEPERFSELVEFLTPIIDSCKK